MATLALQKNCHFEQAAIEEWRPVVGYEGHYEVSSLGRVRSLDRIISITKAGRAEKLTFKGRTLKCAPDNYGYPRVVIRAGVGKPIQRRVHKIVAEAFLGACPEGMEVAHNDGDPMNAKVTNLRYATHTSNLLDKRKHGTMPRGQTHHASRLSDDDIREIRSLSGQVFQRVLAERFGCDQSSISLIVRRKRWAHIPD